MCPQTAKGITLILLSVDPGVISGWAVFDVQPNNAPKLIDHGQIRIELKRNADWVDFWEHWGCYPQASIICEGQFMQTGQTKKIYGQQRCALKTSSAAGQWEGVARVHGWHVFDRVHPSTWRAAIFGRTRNIDTKKLALTYAKNVWHVHLTASKHHTAEAICIGSYQAQNILMGHGAKNKKP